MTSARDLFERNCHAALSRYKIDVADGMWRVTADNKLVDAVLRAWERSMADVGKPVPAWRREMVIPPPDPAPVTAARRAQLDDARSQAYVAAIRRNKVSNA